MESNTNKVSNILVVGDAFIDIVTTMDRLEITPGGDKLASSISLLPGGSGLNTSVRMKEIGKNSLNVIFFSAIGDDEQGKLLSKAVVDGGVNPNFIVMSEYATGSCIVLSTKDERSFITNRGVINRITCKDFNGPNGEPFNGSLNGDLDHVHVAGYYNCPRLSIGIESALENCFKYGYSTSLNPQCDAKGEYDMIDSMCKFLSYLFCNEEELRGMALGCFEVKGKTIEDCALPFINAGCAHIVVTNGAKGATCFYIDPTHSRPSELTVSDLTEVSSVPPKVEVVDTTGAGDAFIAGFLTSIVPRRSTNGFSRTEALVLELRETLANPNSAQPTNRDFDTSVHYRQRVDDALKLGCLAGAHCCTLLGCLHA